MGVVTGVSTGFYLCTSLIVPCIAYDPRKFEALRMVPVPRHVREEMLDLLKAYVKQTFTSEPVEEDTAGAKSSIKHPYYIIASTCADFCVYTDQVEVLFGDVYQRFVGVKMQVRRSTVHFSFAQLIGRFCGSTAPT